MFPKESIITNGKKLIIKEATSGDAKQVLEYAKTIFTETEFLCYSPDEFKMTIVEEEEFLSHCLNSEYDIYLIAIADEKIVSSLNFSAGKIRRTKHAGEIGMSVLKEMWGMGIGGLMLDTLVEWANSTNQIQKINLRVRTDNDRAIQLYQNKGFEIEGTLRNEILIDGKFYDHYWMGLLL